MLLLIEHTYIWLKTNTAAGAFSIINETKPGAWYTNEQRCENADKCTVCSQTHYLPTMMFLVKY